MGFKKKTAGVLLAAFTALGSTIPAGAQSPDAITFPDSASTTMSASEASGIKYANGVYLAYIKTSSAGVNDTAQKGLEVLGGKLVKQTSIEPRGVVALDINTDDLKFFRFIYWPVMQDAAQLSPEAQKKVQDYLQSGGVILFDILDNDTSLGNYRALQRMLGDVSLKPLIPIPEDHTLTKAFYLVNGLPGTNNFGTVWVEKQEEGKTEHISSVIIGESNWAGAWAGRTLSPASRDREMALRSGVNMVMFALMGNYKQDQVHVPALLDKLGR